MFKARRRACFRNLTFQLLSGVAGIFFATQHAAANEWLSSFNLSAISGNSALGYRFGGAAANDRSGSSVANAGDVNGDGFDEVITGAPDANSGGGESSLFRLLPEEFVVTFSDVHPDDQSGASVAGSGDFNGDGIDDVLIGVPNADPTNESDSGSTYVVFGNAAGLSSNIDLSSINSTTGFRIDGAIGLSSTGRAVAFAGDVNGDGFDDVVIGAPYASPNGGYSGASYVVFGKPAGTSAAINVSKLNGKNGFRIAGVAAGDTSGRSVATAGDVNGDGIDDLLIGAYLADPNGNAQAGSTYVVFGKSSAFASSFNLSKLNGNNGFRLDGVGLSDFSGRSIAPAGDVNGDGFDDVIIGASDANPNGQNSGSAYVFFGKENGFGSAVNLSSLDGDIGIRLDGAVLGDYAGKSVSSAGDLNCDGFDDVIIGAHSADNGNIRSGSTYVVFGKAEPFSSTMALGGLNGTTGFRMDGEAQNDRSGNAVGGGGDVNGDGFSDVLVGAYTASVNGNYSGATYVVFGRAPDASVTRIGSAAGQTICGGEFDDVLSGLDGPDFLDGRDGGDALDGGTGSNTASYRHAALGVVVDLAAPGNNTGEALGDSYTNIQNLEGSGLADTLTGDGGKNRLTGGKDKDSLKGGGNKDTFAYRFSVESPPGAANADIILDFNPGTASSVVDKIDLSAVDAKSGKGGNQAFTFRGTKAFNGKGQVRLKKSGADVIVQGNTGGSNAAEFEIVLKGLASKIGKITAKDFKL